MRRDGGEAAPRTDGCWILFRLGRIFALCSFLNSKSDVGMVAARGAHAIECAHARRVIRGWMGPWDGREGGIEAREEVESFVRSLLLYGDSMSRSTDERRRRRISFPRNAIKIRHRRHCRHAPVARPTVFVPLFSEIQCVISGGGGAVRCGLHARTS